jgi:NADP-dependent 3-hydroxy acid dehydrogenase YdfG
MQIRRGLMARAIHEQVVVITGASSGVGHATARKFAERGARIVVGARRIDILNEFVDSITRAGGQAAAVQTDVSERSQVEWLARAAVERFGRIDTWVNNAGISIYATFDKLTDEEIRRLMDVNFMGTVYGIQAALAVMREQGEGTIINVASVAGKRGFPLQSIYTASKFAIVGLGEALRAELAKSWPAIHISTICTPAINTAFFDNARTKEGYTAKPMPPLDCAEYPKREVIIGAAGKTFVLSNRLAGGVMDWALGKIGRKAQLTEEPKSATAPANLFEPSPETFERGNWSVRGTRRQ